MAPKGDQFYTHPYLLAAEAAALAALTSLISDIPRLRAVSDRIAGLSLFIV
jgi:hypothetical protein